MNEAASISTSSDAADLESADVESSSDAYAERFSGPVGQWMLAVQESVTKKLLERCAPGTTLLDVGGGHGQLALPLSRDRFRVTVLGSAPVCARRIQTAVDAGQCRFVVGNPMKLPFESQSFDVAMSFRMLPHCVRWQTLLSELCRVARKGIVVDYPTSQSLNCIAPRMFEAKKRYEESTRAWRSFKHREVVEAFAAHGFELARMEKQFFLPMVVHRMLSCRLLSRAMETIFRTAGLTRLYGSPVIALFLRK